MIAILKYNAGNTGSVAHALRRLGVEPLITGDPETLRQADRVIFPGVGEARTTMEYLRQHGLDRLIRSLRQPVLGICLGMQLMCRHSEEGDAECLHIFDGDVRRFVPQQHGDKVPHVGWNTLEHLQGALFDAMPDSSFVYFVHSYYVPLNGCTAATADYILPFSAALHRDNFYAVQFHPEKSGAAGASVLKNFLSL
jgi:glutamine amidotransferase